MKTPPLYPDFFDENHNREINKQTFKTKRFAEINYKTLEEFINDLDDRAIFLLSMYRKIEELKSIQCLNIFNRVIYQAIKEKAEEIKKKNLPFCQKVLREYDQEKDRKRKEGVITEREIYEFREKVIDTLNYQTREQCIRSLNDLDLVLLSFKYYHSGLEPLFAGTFITGTKLINKEIDKRFREIETRRGFSWIKKIESWCLQKKEQARRENQGYDEISKKRNEVYVEACLLFGNLKF